MAGGEGMDDAVTLTDLDVIARWSLAVRGGEAPREELIAVLQGDLDWLEAGRPPRAVTPGAPVARRRAPRA